MDRLKNFLKVNCFTCDAITYVSETYKGRHPICPVCRQKQSTPPLSKVISKSIASAHIGYIAKDKGLSLPLGVLLKQSR